MNLALLRRTWEAATSHGDAFFAHFYGRLFLAHPGLRPLFGTSMEGQREKIAAMLDLVVRGADNIEAVVPEVRDLGERHRRYGVTVEMFAPVGEALIGTFERYLGDEWTDEAGQTWADAFALVSGVMADVISKATEPATWDVMVLETFRLGDVVHLVLDIDHEVPWRIGGLMPVRIADRPGTWRNLRMEHTRELLVPIDDRPDGVTLDLLTLQPGDHLLLALPLDPIDPEVTK